MAKTKKNERASLRGMKESELLKELSVARENLRARHFKAEGSRSKNVKESASFKKHIARILTQLNTSNQK